MVNQSQFIEETKLWENEGTIRDLIHNTVEKAGKKYSADSKIRYIDISSVDNETNTVTGVTEYIFKDAPSRAQQCVKRGDILVSTVRPNLKNIAVNHLDGEDLVASSGFCVLRPKEGCTGLIMAYILSDVFTEKMTLVAKGTNYPAIHDSDILDYKIRLPEDSKMSMIDRLFRQADKSKFAGFKSQFIEMFGDPITNSKKCIVKKGSELFIFSSGKANTRANLNASYKFDCFGGNGTTGKSKDYLIDFTTLVIGRVGEYCGSVHITPTYSWITDNAIYIKDFKDKDLDIKYLYYLFRFLDLHRLSAKTGQPKITQEALLGIDYICPNVEEQKGYVTFAHHADKSKYLN